MTERDQYTPGSASGAEVGKDGGKVDAHSRHRSALQKATKTASPGAKKAAARPGPRAGKADSEAAVLAKIAAMPAPHGAMGERLHALILRSAPALQSTVWYGMPAYAKDGKVICFFRADKKYMTFGFTQEANLTPEQGAPHQLIESAWYFTALDEATESKLSAIVRKFAS